MAEDKLPLAVAIITLNEADRLADCLASVAFAAEVVVVDSGSTDGTLDIARQHGARVFLEEWHGFGPQKQLAIDHCRQDWILVLDADERVSAEAAAEIGDIILHGDDDIAAYSLPRKNIFCGRWIKHMGWWPDRVVRLFKRGRARMSGDMVHEALLVDGAVGCVAAPLVHYANKNLSQTLSKVNRYSSIGARQLYEKGVNASVTKAFLRAAWAFTWNYIWRGGFLDGGPGLTLAVSDFMNVFFKFAKLGEIHRDKQKKQ